jgi:peptidoglycan/xylan/chitin deacetylase (PgdA/CDA1 family)
VDTAKALPILMYHHVSPQPGLVTITPEHFAAQMAWLAGQGYHTARCADLEGFLQGKPLPAKSLLLTFDDGYLDNYVHAYPILRQHGLHAVIFVVTDWIGDGPARPVAGESGAPALLNHRECYASIQAGRADEAVMRWSEVERTRAEGIFEFQSHTASHTRWDRVGANPAEKVSALRADLERSQETLCQRLGQTDPHLCWPQGYFDADYVSVANELGFSHLYTTRPGTVCSDTEAARLPRIVVKDKGAAWLASRLRLYRSPMLARWYGRLKGH